jgi:excisionase family DNA binding protein
VKCKCGFELNETTKFCSECGRKAPKPEPKHAIDADLALKQVDQVLNVAEAARFLKISRNMLYELIYQRRVPHFRTGNRYKFLTSALIQWVREQQVA